MIASQMWIIKIHIQKLGTDRNSFEFITGLIVYSHKTELHNCMSTN